MRGIVAYGAYLPYYRLQRTAIGAALGSGKAKGSRSVASYDEDTTSMGVEAGRLALKSIPSGAEITSLLFSTSNPAYLDKTNASAIHAALGLDRGVGAYDMGGAPRSFVGALNAAMAGSTTTMVIASDVRTGLPGGADEANGGDGAAAFVLGEGPDVVADHLASAAVTAEFLDRWRVPGDLFSRQWEERFGEFAYLPLVEQAVTDAFKSAGITATDVDHLVVAGVHARAAKGVPKIVGVRPDVVVDDLSSQIGNAGTAQAGMILADVLDRAAPGEVIALVVLADGCDVVLFKTTEALAQRRATVPVRTQLATTNDTLAYQTFVTWRGFFDREPPRRPEPDRPAAPPSNRRIEWKFGFVGSKDANGFIHLPPGRVSLEGNDIDHMDPVRMADVPATVATFTVDHLGYSLNPPRVLAVIDFDGGGRFYCELTDVDPAAVAIGDRVEMSFRRLYTQGGVHDYFWKAKPRRG